MGDRKRIKEVGFFKVVEDRSANTIILIIKIFVEPGTIILSDWWKAYSSLKSEGYQHLTVSHFIELKTRKQELAPI